jgi:hypothetical protein
MCPYHTRTKARLSKFLLLSWAFLFPVVSLFAQFHYSQNCQKAYQDIINLHFQEARKLISLEKAADPGNLVPAYLENYIDFLTVYIGEERSQYDRIKPLFLARIDALETGYKSSPYFNFFLGEANLQLASVQMKFGEYTQAALRVRKAHHYYTENEKNFPDFIPNYIGLGITHVLGGIVPDSYKWIANLMGVDGTIGQGLQELKSAADYNGFDALYNLYRPQALVYLAMISANLTRDKSEALRIFAQIEKNNKSQSLLITFARANIMMKNGLNAQALELLKQRPRDAATYPFYYLDFMEGVAKLNSLDTSAMNDFRFFLDHFRGINYIKSAWQKMAWMEFIKGDSIAYRQSMDKILASGNPSGEEDRQAIREAQLKQFPNLVLLRARLLFDGGYYDRALSELLNRPTKKFLFNRKDLLEYSYRLGRIYHESGNPDKALSYYRLTVQRGKHESWYFAAAAALQMGLIYENKGELSMADSAYHVCLSCKPADYKNSLSQKAKAGISRIKSVRP